MEIGHWKLVDRDLTLAGVLLFDAIGIPTNRAAHATKVVGGPVCFRVSRAEMGEPINCLLALGGDWSKRGTVSTEGHWKLVIGNW